MDPAVGVTASRPGLLDRRTAMLPLFQDHLRGFPTVRTSRSITTVGLLLLAAMAVGCTSPTVVPGTPTTSPASPTGGASPTSGASPTEEAPEATDAPTEGPTDGEGTPVPTEVARDSWTINATGLRDRVGEQVTFQCSPDGVPRTVWGTDIYTDDSSVCTAAVHAGEITVEEGGTVTIEVVEGQDTYTGSERNGITTSDYGAWGGSFSIVTGD
jgi:hypothetical protein